MSHHILEKDPLDLDHKLCEDLSQATKFSSSMDVENGPIHIDEGTHPDEKLHHTSSTPSRIPSASSSPSGTETSPSNDHQQCQSRWTDLATPTSANVRYPAHSMNQIQAGNAIEPKEGAPATLQLRPSALVANQDRRAAIETDDEEPVLRRMGGFESLRPEDEDFYDSYHSSREASTASLGSPSESFVPLFRSRRPFVQTSPAPEGCACGAAWHSSPSPSPAEASPPISRSERNTPRKGTPASSLQTKLEAPSPTAETSNPQEGRSAASFTNNPGLWSGARALTMPPVPPAPANSPHDELPPVQMPGQRYIGPPGSSSEWPHWFTPIGGSEEAKAIKCGVSTSPGSGVATGAQSSAELACSRPSDGFEGKLDRVKNTSFSSIHANVENIDDVERCPAVQKELDVDTKHIDDLRHEGMKENAAGTRTLSEATVLENGAADPEVEYWIKKILEMQEEICKYNFLHGEARFWGSTSLVVPRIDVGTRKRQVQQAEEMLATMENRGFQRTQEWEAQYNRLLKYAMRSSAYPLLSFIIENFAQSFLPALDEYAARLAKCQNGGHNVEDLRSGPRPLVQSAVQSIKEGPSQGDLSSKSRDQAETSLKEKQPNTEQSHDEEGPTNELNDLNAAAARGVIDGCEAVMRIMRIAGSHSSNNSYKEYTALLNNARERGEVDSLVEYVRQEAKNGSTLGDAARAAAVKTRKPQERCGSECGNCNGEDDFSMLRDPRVHRHSDGSVSTDDEDTIEEKVFKWQSSGYYKTWTSRNIPRGGPARVVWIANPWVGGSYGPNSAFASTGDYETSKPILLTLGHFFEGDDAATKVSFMALAVKITPSCRKQAESSYAEVVLQDSGYHERFSSPLRVQAFGIGGVPFDLDQAGIVAHISGLSEKRPRGKGKQPMRTELDEQPSARVQGYQSSSSSSSITLRHHENDEPTAGGSDVYFGAEEATEPPKQVFSDLGMTFVPLEDFPAIPADPCNLEHREIGIVVPSTIFVNCKRCHKILASFEGVVDEPIVIRRAQGELGDSYIVTRIVSSSVIASVDNVKRVWVHVGTEKYFMRANEDGSQRTHECVSVEETIRAEIMQKQTQHSHYVNGSEYGTSGHDRPGSLPPPEQPSRQPHLPRREAAETGALPSGSIRMPSSMQFLPVHPNFATAEMKVHPPSTVIAVCERLGTIHGVYQGAVGYRALYRAHEESGETVRLEIRDGLGAFVGRLCSIRFYEVGLMNGQVASFTAQDEIIEMPELSRSYVPQIAEMDAHPPCTIIAVCEQQGIVQEFSQPTIRGVYQGVTNYRVILRDAGERGETVRLDIRDPFGALIGQFCRVRYYQVAMMNGLAVDFRAQEAEEEAVEPADVHNHSPAHHQAMDAEGSSFEGGARPDDNEETQSLTGSDQSELGLRGGAGEGSTDEDAMSRQPQEEWVSTGAAAEVPRSQQFSGFASHPSENVEQKDTCTAIPRAIEASNTVMPSQFPRDDSDRIPHWLQATSSVGPSTDDGEPVFSEEYKKWLRSMYTRPSNQRCAVVDGPSFQDFWKDREAGRPTTMANGTTYRPQQDQVAYQVADTEEGEYIPLPSKSRDKAKAQVHNLPESQNQAGDGSQASDLERKEAQREARYLAFMKSQLGYSPRVIDVPDNWPPFRPADTAHSTLEAKTRPHAAQPAVPNPKLVPILNKFLHEQAVKKEREAYNAAVGDN